jgi:hypothetical protein
MNSRERVLSPFNKNGYDRIPVKHEGTPEINKMIMDHFGLNNMEQLLRVLGDEFRYVDTIYIGPEFRKFDDGSIEGYWGERYKYAVFEGGKFWRPAIWPLALNNLGSYINKGSALLIMAISGGALLPLVWGKLSDL